MVACSCDELGEYAYDPNVKVLWVNSIETVLNPTSAEVTGGVYLNDDPYNLTDIIGWEIEGEVLTEPPWGPFAVQRIGGLRVIDARLILAAKRDGSDIRSLLSRGTSGFILIFPSGRYEDCPDAPLNVYPVCVASIFQMHRHGSSGASRIMVKFAVSAPPGESVVVSP